MAKQDSGAQKMLAEVQSIKEEIVGFKSSNEKRFTDLEKMCRDIMAALSEISDTNAKILTSRPSGGSKSTAARKTAAQSYVDADGKMKSSSEWFKCIWVNDPEGTAAKYISKKQLEALNNEFSKNSKHAQLPADKKLKEQAVFLWNTFVRKTSEKADNTLRAKIVEGYSKASKEVEDKKKATPAAAEEEGGEEEGGEEEETGEGGDEA